MSDFKLPKIEKGIPIPYQKRRGYFRDIAKKMEIGDSVAVNSPSEASGVVAAGRVQGKQMTSRRFEDGTHRVWYVGPLEEELEW